ncbi:iron ABC transporter permease [Staphylococcus pseudintermedius]|uniref:FecCD family ABC transporter permease n=1 Tax=Staphylococcus pseudintermedius TaxID=283734 RepID=UPI0011202AE4|nr:iron ABC transporter permease [Staphylococcus pseudintermedius]MBM0387042.1 iron ABC transporter permease [Staphylococcus pseudintermedius]MBM0389629.1 iron ABC transporter permease [Staphylococcus pseudintermedius]MBM0392297.1 iron ABC transporter permease [Staphylococcus pseudintermedius]TOZ07732.1 iron ABC transporter [Staphylococcus pseudintermedius]TOZ35377.1 iron ABC transporter [Staphylococcus pseudintermedius]
MLKKRVNMKWSDAVQFICAVIVLCIVFIIATLLGEAHVNLSTIFEAIFHYNPKIQAHNVISEVRIPRNIGAVLVGMALATAGAVIQGVSKNGLADPGLIGLNAWAAFALALTFALFPGASFIAHIIAGFIGAMLGGAIVMTIGASRRDGFNPMRLILAGAAVSALLTALSQGVALIFRLNQAINFWSAGGVSGTNWQQIQISVPIILVTLILLILMGRQLTILSLGDALAVGLGQNIKMVRTVALILSMLLAGVSVAMVGQVAFVGLIVPHIVRSWVGTDYMKVLPMTAVVGGTLVLGSDLVARLLGEAPMSAVISFIGVPYFFYLIRKGGRTL